MLSTICSAITRRRGRDVYRGGNGHTEISHLGASWVEEDGDANDRYR